MKTVLVLLATVVIVASVGCDKTPTIQYGPVTNSYGQTAVVVHSSTPVNGSSTVDWVRANPDKKVISATEDRGLATIIYEDATEKR